MRVNADRKGIKRKNPRRNNRTAYREQGEADDREIAAERIRKLVTERLQL